MKQSFKSFLIIFLLSPGTCSLAFKSLSYWSFQELQRIFFLNLTKKTILIIYKEILKVSIYKSCFSSRFQNYPLKYYHDNSIPNVSNVYKNSQKHEARKYVGISWNSNQQLACEINCDLVPFGRLFWICAYFRSAARWLRPWSKHKLKKICQRERIKIWETLRKSCYFNQMNT